MHAVLGKTFINFNDSKAKLRLQKKIVEPRMSLLIDSSKQILPNKPRLSSIGEASPSAKRYYQ